MELIIVLALLALLAVVVLPIVSLAKLSSIENRLRYISSDLQRLKGSGGAIKAGTEPDGEAAEQAVTELLPEAMEVRHSGETAPEEVETIAESPLPEEPAAVAAACSAIRESAETVSEPISEPEPEPEPVREEEPEPKQRREPGRWIPAMSFENLLSKIGIITLVLGVAFFVKYAIDKDWINEVGRVGIGILTGAALIGVAHKLRKAYNVFSALMVGGGISVLYITITLAFREYELFDQTTAFIILIAITVFAVILSLVYDRKELALFSLLGGYASPLMVSTGEGNYIVLFSFLLILNSGMLAIAMRKNWRIIGLVSFVCSQAFFWTWLLTSFETQYAGALIFAALFFVQFYLLALLDHARSGKRISAFQAGGILANNLSMFAAAVFIFNDSSVKIAGLITICMAVVNAVVMGLLFRKKEVDTRLLYLIVAIVLSFVSLAVPVQLDGHVITMFWAAEIVILLWLWYKSGIKVFYAGFWLMTALTLGSYFMDVEAVYVHNPAHLPVAFNRMFITGLVVIASFVISKATLRRIQGAHSGPENTVLKCAIAAMSYLVPMLEIKYQFDNSPLTGFSEYTGAMLAIYSIVYLAVLAFVFRARIRETRWMFAALAIAIAGYIAAGLPLIASFRYDAVVSFGHTALFSVHYLALPALGYLFCLLARSMQSYSRREVTCLSWGLVTAAVILFSVELDNTAVQLWGSAANYHDLLHDIRTIGYPILWGLLAMALMLWGLKSKTALLRQISLVFFALIILKFYINDIWIMSQAGRIVSFVMLGVILLTVSFLIEKIKVLIKEDETTDRTQLPDTDN